MLPIELDFGHLHRIALEDEAILVQRFSTKEGLLCRGSVPEVNDPVQVVDHRVNYPEGVCQLISLCFGNAHEERRVSREVKLGPVKKAEIERVRNSKVQVTYQ
jgi:hypothetical protein